MRRDPFKKELKVALTEDERNARGRQTARLKVALAKHEERAKEVKKKLREEEEEIETALHKAARAAEDGEELRLVECEEIMRGVMVETIRLDTKETVESRPATEAELAGEDDDEPGSGSGPARKGSPKKKGATPGADASASTH